MWKCSKGKRCVSCSFSPHVSSEHKKNIFQCCTDTLSSDESGWQFTNTDGKTAEDERKGKFISCLCLRCSRVYIFLWNLFRRLMNEPRGWTTHLFTQQWMSIEIATSRSAANKYECCGPQFSGHNTNYTRWINKLKFNFRNTATVPLPILFHSSIELRSRNWFPLFSRSDCLRSDFRKKFSQFQLGVFVSQFKHNSWISSFKQILAQVPLKWNDKTLMQFALLEYALELVLMHKQLWFSELELLLFWFFLHSAKILPNFSLALNKFSHYKFGNLICFLHKTPGTIFRGTILTKYLSN